MDVPPLEMVDDITSASKCARNHIGSKKNNHECPHLKVDEEEMRNSNRETNLVDFVTTKANANETLEARKIQAYGILLEIRAILSEIPLGQWRLGLD